MNLGENIYRLRTERNMSQGDFADAMEVSRQSVSKWENNSAVPELDKLVKMAEVFGITLDELVRGASPAPLATQATPASMTAPNLSIRTIIGIIVFSIGVLISLVCLLIDPAVALIVSLLIPIGLVLMNPKLKHTVWAGCGIFAMCYTFLTASSTVLDCGFIEALVVWGLSTFVGWLFYRYIEDHNDSREGNTEDSVEPDSVD